MSRPRFIGRCGNGIFPGRRSADNARGSAPTKHCEYDLK